MLSNASRSETRWSPPTARGASWLLKKSQASVRVLG
ncbi:hypothetical protein SAMN05443247_07961 [Bradyrhizobium erythrophlei]|nr:hypothetical protein SAMN05443247_07961 [Bradyrhizobium erythrophlei]